MMKRLVLLTVLFFGAFGAAYSQGLVAIKGNLLYGGAAFTPNLGVEVALSKRLTLDISGGYNWFNLTEGKNSNRKMVHYMVQPEVRYFLCERFNGHFFGAHLLFSEYNIGGHELPLLFGKGSGKYRHQGWAAGVGISYGYQLMLSRSWNLEFNLGFGYANMNYDTYDCAQCGKKLDVGKSKHYFGPTKAAVSVVWVINNKKK